MCRNIKMLFNFDPPVTPAEVQAASLQFVRKISGFNKPSKANEPAFLSAVQQIADISTNLLNSLETNCERYTNPMPYTVAGTGLFRLLSRAV